MESNEYKKYQDNLIKEWEKKVTPVPQFSERLKFYK